nr:MAG TPA: Triosephosphate isomerase [Caudoviricetes sp.]
MPIVVNGTTLTDLKVGNTDITKVYARNGETGTYVLVFEKGGTVVVALYIGGNWKMNKTKAEIDSYFETFNAQLDLNEQKQVVIFPPTCYLDYVKSKIPARLSGMVKVGAQWISKEEQGAYTGQISAIMAKDCGCSTVMVGAGEVRQYLGITNEDCSAQIKLAISQGLDAWLNVGEPLEEREQGTANDYVINQLATCLSGVTMEDVKNHLIIVYEPLWAIGTGHFCTPQQGGEMGEVIKNKIADMYDGATAEKVPILFGGSVKPQNIQEIVDQPTLSGALAGGAAINPSTFVEMINII